MRRNNKGKFIVIDGTDGSGKATQAAMLAKRLREDGQKVAKIDFPQYGKKSAGLVEEYLNGNFGKAEDVGPYAASIFYACDRFAAAKKIRKWLAEGKIVLSDRYVTANMGHQGGKIKDGKERTKYFKWLYELEYDIFGIPKPDVNLILHVDASVAQKLAISKGKKNYIKKGKQDIHENSLQHLRNAEKAYLEIARIFPDIKLIECTASGEIMSRKKISDLIFKSLDEIN
jgi:dTMP kinase